LHNDLWLHVICREGIFDRAAPVKIRRVGRGRLLSVVRFKAEVASQRRVYHTNEVLRRAILGPCHPYGELGALLAQSAAAPGRQTKQSCSAWPWMSLINNK
jgi:hypothetical protein